MNKHLILLTLLFIFIQNVNALDDAEGDVKALMKELGLEEDEQDFSEFPTNVDLPTLLKQLNVSAENASLHGQVVCDREMDDLFENFFNTPTPIMRKRANALSENSAWEEGKINAFVDYYQNKKAADLDHALRIEHDRKFFIKTSSIPVSRPRGKRADNLPKYKKADSPPQ